MASEKVSQSLTRALQDLLDERARIDDTIAKLQGFIGQLSGAPVPARRGRPPKGSVAPAAKVRRKWTAAGRRAAAERMRKYWASRRKAAGATKKVSAKPSTRSKAWNPAARKAAAERMRKYWADRKKASQGG